MKCVRKAISSSNFCGTNSRYLLKLTLTDAQIIWRLHKHLTTRGCWLKNLLNPFPAANLTEQTIVLIPIAQVQRDSRSFILNLFICAFTFKCRTVYSIGFCCATCKPFSFPHTIFIHISSTQWTQCLKIISFKRYLQLRERKIGRNEKS